MTFRISRGLSRRRFLPPLAQAPSARLPCPISAALPTGRSSHQACNPATSAPMARGVARADRPSQMLVEVATSESFANARRCRRSRRCPKATSRPKCCWKTCPRGSKFLPHPVSRSLGYQYRERAVVGRFRTAPGDRRDVSFVWVVTSPTGLGHQPRRRRHVYLRRHAASIAQIFCCIRRHGLCRRTYQERGDAPRRQGLEECNDPGKAKVAETLDEFRAAHKYNFMDEHVRAFNAEVPIFVQWDDHEVTNNWSLSKQLPAAYKERNITLLAARAARASTRCIRCAKASSSLAGLPHAQLWSASRRLHAPTNAAIAAPTAPTCRALTSRKLLPRSRPVAWLKRALLNSRATWKVSRPTCRSASSSMTMRQQEGSEAFAQGRWAAARPRTGDRRHLRFIKTSGIVNTVWLTADVHYAAAHYYNPDKAQFQEFDPFWEFVSGPLHAGTFGPNELDKRLDPR